MPISRTAFAFAAAFLVLLPATAAAYTAVGDRVFPATILLPQAAPGDALYVTPSTLPVPGGNATNLTATLDKTLTERLGIGIQDGYNWIGRDNASTLVGWQNLLAYVKYEAILDPPHEFLFSIGTAHEFGGTGTHRVGAPDNGATLVPTTFFAKGLGDLPIGYFRPLGLQGFATYQLSSGAPRPDNFLAGLAVEYSNSLSAIKGQSVRFTGSAARDDAHRRDIGRNADTEPRRQHDGRNRRSRGRVFRARLAIRNRGTRPGEQCRRQRSRRSRPVQPFARLLLSRQYRQAVIDRTMKHWTRRDGGWLMQPHQPPSAGQTDRVHGAASSSKGRRSDSRG